MAMSRLEIQKRSDEKRGVKLCGFKFKLETIDKLDALAAQQGMSKTALLEKLIEQACSAE